MKRLHLYALGLALLAGCVKTNTETQTVTVAEAPADSTYLVEYAETSPAAIGKSTFTLRVRKRADFTAASGLAIAVKPLMVMPAGNHSTPAAAIAETATAGTYAGALYYLMAGGAGQGYWAIAFDVGGETHTVYPTVAAAAGSETILQRLWGPTDLVSSTVQNKFILFRDGRFTGAQELDLHLSHGENNRMIFKPVTAGAVLSPEGAVAAVSLTASTDPAFGTTVAGVDRGGGRWTVDLSTIAMAPAVATTVYVKLRVNGEDKTTDGLAPAGNNARTSFTVTPAAAVAPAGAIYAVDYLAGAAPAAMGKTSFQLRVRHAMGGSPASGVPIAVKPVMHMPTMVHGAPATVVTESATAGTYDATIYYLMASGAGMGFWDLQVDVGGEVHSISPAVGMAMGTDTLRRNLFDVGGSTSGMADRYFLFRDGRVLAADGVVRLHLTRSEDMLMTFRPVDAGATLANGPVASVALTAAGDADFTAPVAAANLGDGHWSVDLSSLGFAPAVATTVYVKLEVNGEVKTTDAAAASGANGSTPFVITPQ